MNNLVTKRSLSLSLSFVFQVIINGGTCGRLLLLLLLLPRFLPLLHFQRPQKAWDGNATERWVFRPLSPLSLGGLFVLVKVHTTSDAFCEDEMSNRLESEREEEGDDREMFFASSNGRETLEEVEEAMMTTSSTGDANEAGRSAARDERGEKDYDDDDDESLKDTTTKILAETEEEETGSTGNRHNNTASTKKRSKRGPSGCTPNRVRELTAEALKNPKGAILPRRR